MKPAQAVANHTPGPKLQSLLDYFATDIRWTMEEPEMYDLSDTRQVIENCMSSQMPDMPDHHLFDYFAENDWLGDVEPTQDRFGRPANQFPINAYNYEDLGHMILASFMFAYLWDRFACAIGNAYDAYIERNFVTQSVVVLAEAEVEVPF